MRAVRARCRHRVSSLAVTPWHVRACSPDRSLRCVNLGQNEHPPFGDPSIMPRAAVLRDVGSPLEVVDLRLDDPRVDEIEVSIAASGTATATSRCNAGSSGYPCLSYSVTRDRASSPNRGGRHVP